VSERLAEATQEDANPDCARTPFKPRSNFNRSHNNSNNNSGSGSCSGSSSGSSSSSSSSSGRSGVVQFDGGSNNNPLDSFFPFDPCLLEQLSCSVAPSYRVWQGVPGLNADGTEGEGSSSSSSSSSSRRRGLEKRMRRCRAGSLELMGGESDEEGMGDSGDDDDDDDDDDDANGTASLSARCIFYVYKTLHYTTQHYWHQ